MHKRKLHSQTDWCTQTGYISSGYTLTLYIHTRTRVTHTIYRAFTCDDSMRAKQRPVTDTAFTRDCYIHWAHILVTYTDWVQIQPSQATMLTHTSGCQRLWLHTHLQHPPPPPLYPFLPRPTNQRRGRGPSIQKHSGPRPLAAPKQSMQLHQ